MWREFSLAARGVVLFSGILLAAGALIVSILAFKAANAERPDPNTEVAALTAGRADAAATAIGAQLLGYGDLLASLAKAGGAKIGGGGAMRLASRAFDRTPGLEQLAAYGSDGRTRWVMRPAERGRVLFPPQTDFVAAHFDQAANPVRLAAPVRPSRRGRWWTPISYLVRNSAGEGVAVIVAFVASDVFQATIADTGQIGALYTDAGVLTAAAPSNDAPIGASFSGSPGFRKIEGDGSVGGAYLAETESGPAPLSMIGYRKLECCGAIVTSIAPAEMPPTPDAAPLGRWLAIAAAGLMTLLALAIIARKSFDVPPDPWRDFGRHVSQPLA